MRRLTGKHDGFKNAIMESHLPIGSLWRMALRLENTETVAWKTVLCGDYELLRRLALGGACWAFLSGRELLLMLTDNAALTGGEAVPVESTVMREYTP